MADFDLNLTMAPSGAFASTGHAGILSYSIPVPTITPATEVAYNPGILEIYRGTYMQVPVGKVPENIITNLQIKDHVITDAGLTDYAHVLRNLTAEFTRHPCHCNLAPLRGARLPALLVETMADGSVAFDYFDFHQGHDRIRANEPRLRAKVLELLNQRNSGQKIFNISVVDVVEGGYGMTALVDLIEDIKRSDPHSDKQHWLIHLRLIHATDLTQRLRDLEHRSVDRFVVVPQFHRVLDTIVEDFDDALGFTLESKNGISFLKPCIRGGRFLYKGSEGLAVIESEDLFLTVQEYAAQTITLDLMTDPSVKMVADRWKDYTAKG